MKCHCWRQRVKAVCFIGNNDMIDKHTVFIFLHVNKCGFWKSEVAYFNFRRGRWRRKKKKTAARLNITQSWFDHCSQGVFVQVKWNPRVLFSPLCGSCWDTDRAQMNALLFWTAAGPARPGGFKPRLIAQLSRGLQLKSTQLHGGGGVVGGGGCTW